MTEQIAKKSSHKMNPLVFFLRTVAKLSCYFVFGVSTIIFSVTLLPLLVIFVHPYARFQRVCRRILHVCLIGYRWYLRISGVAKVTVSDKKKLLSAKSLIIAANHPSLLDSPIILSFLPCSDFIVKSTLSKKNYLSVIVNSIFIANNMEYEEIIERTKKNFAAGGTIALFPEGTRVRKGKKYSVKGGAAMIAIRSGVRMVPVFIGTSKRLFRKIPIIFGKPYTPVYTGRRGTAEEYQTNAEEIMRQAYELGGVR